MPPWSPLTKRSFLMRKSSRLSTNWPAKKIRVIVAGLDTDFRGEPFGPMPELMARAEHVDKLQAICMVCGEPASRTQRLVNGKPARYHDPVVIVGAAEMYEARCRASSRSAQIRTFGVQVPRTQARASR